MRLLKLLVIFMIAITMTACAVMDISAQDTALTLNEKRVSLQYYQALGFDLDSAVSEVDEPEEHSVTPDFLIATKLAVRINPEIDLQASSYLASQSYGAKIGIKKIIMHEGNRYASILPAFTYVSSNPNDDTEGDAFNSYGFEGKLLYSIVFSRHLTGTLGATMNYNSLYRIHDENDEGPFAIVHSGVKGNIQLLINPFLLIPEVGFDVVRRTNGEFNIVPAASLGIGIKL